MNKHVTTCFLLLMAINIALGQQPAQTENPNDEWEIRWSASDEFNNSTPDWSKWIKTGNLPNTTAWKWNNQDNVIINNGVAELTMRQNANNTPDGGTYFKSGILKSYQTFTYGYYEARIKGASIGEGVCPSFWLYSNFDYSVGNGQTVYSEIDIVELQQFDWYEGHQDDIQDMDLNLHCVVMENGTGVWRRPKQYPNEQLNKWRAPWDPRDDFHIYGCEVNEQEIIWYIDGVEVARKPNTYWHRPMNPTLSLGLRKPFVEFYNNRNNAVNPETDPEASAALPGMPTTMYVDYVRVWEKTGTNGNPPLAVGELGNPDFETGDLTYWNASAGNAAVINNNTQSGNSAGSVSNASIAQVVTLSPNTTYTITGFGKVAAGTANAFMGVSEAISNALIQNFEFTSETYSQGVITFTTGASEDNYRVWFWSGGDAYCDNFNLIEGSGGDPDPVAVNGVTVTPATLDLFVGETATLTESVAPGNATDKSVTWNTSDATVATVTNGAINAIGAGTANITVTTNDGGFQAMSEVTVTINNNLLNNPGFEFSDYSSWNIEGNSSIVGNNANGGFQAGYINGNGSINQIVSLEPNATYTASCFGKVGAAGQSVYLGVTNNTTSSFIENTLFTGTTYTQQEIIFTTGNDVNDYKIWFWNNAGGQYYVDDFSLVKNEFSPVPVNGVTLSENSLNLEEGADHSLSANVTPSNASNQNVTWSSDNASIATVNSNGYVQAIAIGTALITVTTTDGGFSDTCTVSVTSGQGGSSGIPQVGQTIWLQSSEGKYLTAITSGTTSIEATATSIGTNEEFLVVDGDGYLALKVVSTNKYVTAASATNTPLRCGASGLYNRQKFTFIEEANGTVSIKAKINGDYCGVNSASANKPVEANYQTIGSGESFRWGEVNSQSRVGSGLSAINEMETAQWSVYPNPYTGGMLKVNFGVPTSGLVRIVDLTGKEIYSRVIQDDEEITIKGISEHSSGMCLIMLKTKDKVLSKRIMMKQN